MNDVALNYKALLFYGLIAGVIALAALYFLKVNPFYTAISSGLTWISAKVGAVNTGGLGALISKNWPTILGVGAAVVPLAYTTIRSYLDKAALAKTLESERELAASKEKSALAAVENAKATTNVEIQSYKDKIAQYENDPALSQLQTNYSSLKDEKIRLQGQIELLNQKLEAEIQKRPVITKHTVS
jgi:hypothetical protein